MAEFASNSSTWPSWFVRICFVSEMDWPNWRSLWPKWSAFGDELVCGRHGCDPFKFGTGLEIHEGDIAELSKVTKIKIQEGRRLHL